MKKILYIDNRNELRTAVDGALGSEFSSYQAAGPVSAFVLFYTVRPDAVVVNAQLPSTTSWNVVRRIKKSALESVRKTPVAVANYNTGVDNFDENADIVVEAGQENELVKYLKRC